jgi:hypothetical protein
MKTVRLVHFYLGVFFAPLIIFFAFTGVLQVFKLHETCRDTSTCLSDWVAWFGQFHKEQGWIPPRNPPKAAASAPAKAEEPKKDEAKKAEPKTGSLVMKWFIALMGMSLMATTLLGLYMAFKYPSRRRGFFIALAAGIVIPLALMAA